MKFIAHVVDSRNNTTRVEVAGTDRVQAMRDALGMVPNSKTVSIRESDATRQIRDDLTVRFSTFPLIGALFA